MSSTVSSSTSVGLSIVRDAGNSADGHVWQARADPRERTGVKVHNTFLEFYATAGEEEGRQAGSRVRSFSMYTMPVARRLGTQSSEGETQQLEQPMLTREHNTMATSAVKESRTDDEQMALSSDVNSSSSTSMMSTGQQPEMAWADWSDEQSEMAWAEGGFLLGADSTDGDVGNWQQGASTTGPLQSKLSQEDLCPVELMVMIRNICCSYTKNQIGAILDESGLAGTYNYIHVPPNHNFRLQKANRGHVFVGFKNSEYAKRCWDLFSGKTFGKSGSEKVCELSWADKPQRLPFFVRKKLYRQQHPAARQWAATQRWATRARAPGDGTIPR